VKPYQIAAKLLVLCAIIMITNMNPRCTDPDEYGPHFDSLNPPPPPPNLIIPPNDTMIIYDHPYPHIINLIWSKVSGAEHYELQISMSTNFSGVIVMVETDTVHAYELPSGDHRYWRVRAYAQAWEWYTDWTDVWHFATWYTP
jgi:hypothetical protein